MAWEEAEDRETNCWSKEGDAIKHLPEMGYAADMLGADIVKEAAGGGQEQHP